MELKKCSSTKIVPITSPDKRNDLNNEIVLFQMCGAVLEAVCTSIFWGWLSPLSLPDRSTPLHQVLPLGGTEHPLPYTHRERRGGVLPSFSLLQPLSKIPGFFKNHGTQLYEPPTEKSLTITLPSHLSQLPLQLRSDHTDVCSLPTDCLLCVPYICSCISSILLLTLNSLFSFSIPHVYHFRALAQNGLGEKKSQNKGCCYKFMISNHTGPSRLSAVILHVLRIFPSRHSSSVQLF